MGTHGSQMKKTLACLLCVTVLTALILGCGKKQPTAALPDAQTADKTTDPLAELTQAAETATAEDLTQQEDFDAENADWLGSFEHSIYGSLSVWYRDRQIAVYDAYGNIKFLFSSHGYTPETSGKEIEMLCEDMNFDGETDFGLLYADNDLNKYYDCWIWNAEKRAYLFSEPLSGIPSPSFDGEKQTVYSYNRISEQNAIVTEYKWQSAGLLPIAHRSLDNGETSIITAPEDVDTPISIFDGLPLSGVTLMGNVDSQSGWLCKIEDETIVTLYSNEHNPVNAMYRFTFQGLRPGATTVVLKYATDWNAEAIADRILNIIVQKDLTLRIIETEH